MRRKKAGIKVAVRMGSNSDYSTMVHAGLTLKKLGVPFTERILSAHRTEEDMRTFARNAYKRGIRVVIAGAGGSAHLPGMISAFGKLLLVLGVPCPSSSNSLNDNAAIGSMAFMPAGAPLGTYSIGKAGAVNAAIDAAKFVADSDPKVARALRRFFAEQAASVPKKPGLPKEKKA